MCVGGGGGGGGVLEGDVNLGGCKYIGSTGDLVLRDFTSALRSTGI